MAKPPPYLSFGRQMNGYLCSLVFCIYVCNFQATSAKLYVSEVVQSVHLSVNEGGTVGAAATAAVLTKSSRHNFRADRPFGFLIKHSSGPVIFVGTYSSPKKPA